MATNKFTKKGQTGGNAAVFLIILVVMMILYLLFLPPADREALLSGSSTPTGTGSGGTGTGGVTPINEYLLRENLGTVLYQDNDEQGIELQQFTIGTNTQGQTITQRSAIYIKNSVFQDINSEIQFQADSELAKDLKLSGNVEKGSGDLIIFLNDVLISQGEVSQGNLPIIELDPDLLKDLNTIRFEVSSPGIAFWRYNEYSLKNVKVTANVKDISTSDSAQAFGLSEADINNIYKINLRYIPSCEESTIEKFEVYINNYRLFRGIPDCGVFNFLSIDEQMLQTGTNELEFKVADGNVLVDRPEIIIKYNDPIYPTYYFDINDKYFSDVKEDEKCGDIDGICPSGCEEDEDKDCCLIRSLNYWCDVEPDNYNDRCVSFVNDCDRCASGYEDRSGKPPDKCTQDYQGNEIPYCGDDTDNYCPPGCSIYYDKDCCYEQDKDNFWCDDLPRAGLQSICEAEISGAECDDCQSGYENENGRSPSCVADNTIEDPDEELKSDYDVKLEILFPNNDLKKIELWINGRKIGIDTKSNTYSRVIDDYVKSGINSIEVRPERDVTITELQIKLLS